MKIKNVEIKGFAALAPMAGVADKAFRELCVGFGADYVVSEMVSSKGISYKNEKTHSLMEISQSERPAAIQLFGSEPATMAQAAAAALPYKPNIIDINMGCPAPKIFNNGNGCALMRSPKLCGEIVKAVTAAVPSDIPVTVKIRKGVDEEHINALEVAKYCQDNGCAAVTIHGRTAKQMYKAEADWEIIAELVSALDIPVIGNGDITTAEKAAQMLEQTGCNLVMVGRAALGNPWIFAQINAWLTDLRPMPAPTDAEKLSVMLRHITKLCQYKGEKIGMKEARKHVSWYLKGFNHAAAFRNRAGVLTTLDDLQALVCDVHRAQQQ